MEVVSAALEACSIEKVVNIVVDKMNNNSRDSLEKQLVLCLKGSMHWSWLMEWAKSGSQLIAGNFFMKWQNRMNAYRHGLFIVREF